MLLIGLLLFGIVVCVFLSATRNEFINFDDTEYVTDNPHVQNGLTFENLKWALTNTHVNWHPLTWLSHMADCEFYGLNPSGHHLTSVLLHALNTSLLFAVLLRMTGAAGRSLAVAALFGLHPLRVESVAWVAERKDVLSGMFLMLTLLSYVEYARRSKDQQPKSKLFYVLAMVTFTLGLMSKPMLVTMPFVLLLLDWWPLNRVLEFKNNASNFVRSSSPIWPFSWLVIEKTPFLLLAALSSVVTFEAQLNSGAVFKTIPLSTRTENALVSYFRYVFKLFWPVDLAVYYPHQHNWPTATVLVCGVMLAVISILVIAAWRRRYFPFGWFWYLGTLVPVVGLVQVGSQSMADRYTYIPTIGVLVMIVWSIHDLTHQTRARRFALAVVTTTTITVCAVLTRRQIDWWKDSETLFRHALTITTENTIALDNLGRALGEKGHVEEAIELYRKSLSLNPTDTLAFDGLGACLTQKGDYDGAAEDFREALNVNPNDGLAHSNLGLILASKGLTDEAINQFDDAARLMLNSAEVQNNLATMLSRKGHFNDAIAHYRAAIRIKPNNAKTHKNLGVILVQIGQLDEAIEQFREAVRLQPGFAEAQNKLRAALELKASTGSLPNPVLNH